MISWLSRATAHVSNQHLKKELTQTINFLFSSYLTGLQWQRRHQRSSLWVDALLWCQRSPSIPVYRLHPPWAGEWRNSQYVTRPNIKLSVGRFLSITISIIRDLKGFLLEKPALKYTASILPSLQGSYREPVFGVSDQDKRVIDCVACHSCTSSKLSGPSVIIMVIWQSPVPQHHGYVWESPLWGRWGS